MGNLPGEPIYLIYQTLKQIAGQYICHQKEVIESAAHMSVNKRLQWLHHTWV